MKIPKVYVATTGEYSDYHIVAIFSKKELAEEYKKLQGGSSDADYWITQARTTDLDIEEWELDRPKDDWMTIEVRIDKEGNVDEIVRSIDGNTGFVCFDYKGNLLWGVRVNKDESAIKVVNEKRAQILAINAWGDVKRMRELLHDINGREK